MIDNEKLSDEEFSGFNVGKISNKDIDAFIAGFSSKKSPSDTIYMLQQMLYCAFLELRKRRTCDVMRNEYDVASNAQTLMRRITEHLWCTNGLPCEFAEHLEDGLVKILQEELERAATK